MTTFNDVLRECKSRIATGEEEDGVVSDVCGQLGTKSLLMVAIDVPELVTRTDLDDDDMEVECIADMIESKLRAMVKSKL